MTLVRRFAVIERQEVVRSLRAIGSRDPDVLHTAKAALLASVRIPRLIGTALFLVGLVCTAAAAPVAIGLPLMFAGWWLRRRGIRNEATVEVVFDEFVKAPAV